MKPLRLMLAIGAVGLCIFGSVFYAYATEPVCKPQLTLAPLCIAYPRWRTWL